MYQKQNASQQNVKQVDYPIFLACLSMFGIGTCACANRTYTPMENGKIHPTRLKLKFLLFLPLFLLSSLGLLSAIPSLFHHHDPSSLPSSSSYFWSLSTLDDFPCTGSEWAVDGAISILAWSKRWDTCDKN